MKKKLDEIKSICDAFDRDFDDSLKSLAEIASLVGSRNRILEDDDCEDDGE